MKLLSARHPCRPSAHLQLAAKSGLRYAAPPVPVEVSGRSSLLTSSKSFASPGGRQPTSAILQGDPLAGEGNVNQNLQAHVANADANLSADSGRKPCSDEDAESGDSAKPLRTRSEHIPSNPSLKADAESAAFDAPNPNPVCTVHDSSRSVSPGSSAHTSDPSPGPRAYAPIALSLQQPHGCADQAKSAFVQPAHGGPRLRRPRPRPLGVPNDA